MALLMSAHERKAAAQPRAEQAEVQAACPQEDPLVGQAAVADLAHLQAELAATRAAKKIMRNKLAWQKAEAALLREQALRLQAEAAAVPYKARCEAALLKLAEVEEVLRRVQLTQAKGRWGRKGAAGSSPV
ncbi:hypothetical protein ABPG77_000818 [Micractinium sp. CCAP 211/92]